MNGSAKGTRNLRAALTQLEQDLETPVVPGEAATWLDTVTAHTKSLAAEFHRARADAYPTMYESTVQADPALERRIEELRADEARLVKELSELESEWTALQQQTEAAEPHEAKREDTFRELTEKALHHIIDMRRYDTSVTTWLMEAYQRDRGVAD